MIQHQSIQFLSCKSSCVMNLLWARFNVSNHDKPGIRLLFAHVMSNYVVFQALKNFVQPSKLRTTIITKVLIAKNSKISPYHYLKDLQSWPNKEIHIILSAPRVLPRSGESLCPQFYGLRYHSWTKTFLLQFSGSEHPREDRWSHSEPTDRHS